MRSLAVLGISECVPLKSLAIELGEHGLLLHGLAKSCFQAGRSELAQHLEAARDEAKWPFQCRTNVRYGGWI